MACAWSRAGGVAAAGDWGTCSAACACHVTHMQIASAVIEVGSSNATAYNRLALRCRHEDLHCRPFPGTATDNASSGRWRPQQTMQRNTSEVLKAAKPKPATCTANGSSDVVSASLATTSPAALVGVASFSPNKSSRFSSARLCPVTATPTASLTIEGAGGRRCTSGRPCSHQQAIKQEATNLQHPACQAGGTPDCDINQEAQKERVQIGDFSC